MRGRGDGDDSGKTDVEKALGKDSMLHYALPAMKEFSEQRRVNYQGIMDIMAMEGLSKEQRKAMIKALPRVQQSSKAPYSLYPQTRVTLLYTHEQADESACYGSCKDADHR